MRSKFKHNNNVDFCPFEENRVKTLIHMLNKLRASYYYCIIIYMVYATVDLGNQRTLSDLMCYRVYTRREFFMCTISSVSESEDVDDAEPIKYRGRSFSGRNGYIHMVRCTRLAYIYVHIDCWRLDSIIRYIRNSCCDDNIIIIYLYPLNFHHANQRSF